MSANSQPRTALLYLTFTGSVKFDRLNERAPALVLTHSVNSRNLLNISCWS